MSEMLKEILEIGPEKVMEEIRKEKEEFLDAFSRFYVNEVLDNAVAPLVAHLAGKDDLSDEELRALKELVEEREGGSDERGA